MVPLNPAFVGKEIVPALHRYLDSEVMGVKLGALLGLS